MKDICSSETSLFVSNDQGITDFNHQSRTCSRVFENSDLHQVAGVDIYCGKVVFTDTTENKIKILDIDGTTKDVAGAGPSCDYDRDGSQHYATFSQPVSIYCEEKTLYICDATRNSIKLITNLNDIARFLQAIGRFYSAFGIHLKGQTPRKAKIQEAREDTLKLELFLDEV